MGTHPPGNRPVMVDWIFLCSAIQGTRGHIRTPVLFPSQKGLLLPKPLFYEWGKNSSAVLYLGGPRTISERLPVCMASSSSSLTSLEELAEALTRIVSLLEGWGLEHAWVLQLPSRSCWTLWLTSFSESSGRWVLLELLSLLALKFLLFICTDIVCIFSYRNGWNYPQGGFFPLSDPLPMPLPKMKMPVCCGVIKDSFGLNIKLFSQACKILQALVFP